MQACDKGNVLKRAVGLASLSQDAEQCFSAASDNLVKLAVSRHNRESSRLHHDNGGGGGEEVSAAASVLPASRQRALTHCRVSSRLSPEGGDAGCLVGLRRGGGRDSGGVWRWVAGEGWEWQEVTAVGEV